MKLFDVSVIVCTVGRPSLLLNALNSVFKASKKSELDIEVIVVFDGCDTINFDCSLDSIILHSKQRVGLAAGRNMGIKQSSGRYIAFLDDDDLFLPLRFKRIERIIRDGLADFIAYDSKIFDVSTQRFAGHVLTQDIKDKTSFLLDMPIGNSSTWICSRSIFENFLFSETIRRGVDGDLLSHLVLNNFAIIPMRTFGTIYRVNHSHQRITGDSFKSKIQAIHGDLVILFKYFKISPVNLLILRLRRILIKCIRIV